MKATLLGVAVAAGMVASFALADENQSQRPEGAGRPDGAGRPEGAGRPDGAGRPSGGGEEFFKRLDRNEDGKISQDEVPEEMWARLSRLDTDEDGQISREEFLSGAAAMRGAMEGDRRPGAPGAEGQRRPGAKGRPGAGGAVGGADAVFSRYDENEDGKLSEDEVPAELWARVRRADEDGDGLVSLEELRKSYQARPEMERPAVGSDAAGKKESADPDSAPVSPEDEGDRRPGRPTGL